MTDEDIERRLADLEALVQQQQATIEEQRERVSDQQATIEAQRERIDELEADETEVTGGRFRSVSRRTALTAGGLLGLAGLTGGAVTANPTGQVGTASRPLGAVYTEMLGGGLTGGTDVTDLTGERLSVAGGTLTADNPSVAVDGTELYANVDRINFGTGLAVVDDGNGELTIERTNVSPTAEFDVANELQEGQRTSFDASPSSDGDGTIVDYEWQVNGSVVGSSETFEYSYTPGGDYTVTLTVTDDNGAEDSVSKTVTAYNDDDGDLYGDANPTQGVPAGSDCDDTNSNTYPGAPELDDNIDNDCDDMVDEGV